MTILYQKPINFINDCNCIVDYELLEKAILWFQKRPTASIKHIYLRHGYATVSIHKTKMFIHRLIYMYSNDIYLKTLQWVHHIDENKLNNSIKNLKLLSAQKHQSLHAKGRPLTDSQRLAICKRNTKYITRFDITIEKIIELREKKYTIKMMKDYFNCSGTTINKRIKKYKDEAHNEQ